MRIYIAAFPRTGVTWLIRLLSDLLDSPQIGPEMPEPTYWGNQGGSHTVTKTHWREDEYPEGDHKVIVSQRDPRDVVVSAMYYRSVEPTDENLMHAMWVMTSITFGIELLPPKQRRKYQHLGWYEKYYQIWLDRGRCDAFTRYELLNDFNELRRIVYELTGNILLEDRIKQSMERQAFERLAPQFPHSMRKGIVGDWKNHFKREHCEYINKSLGEFMLRQGYIDSLDWWKEWQR